MKHTPPGLGFLDEELEKAKANALFRVRAVPGNDAVLSYCSNDYLALGRRPCPSEPSGAGASRLVSGERVVHGRLEQAAATLVGQAAALSFNSGYAANVGLLSSLAGAGDLIVSDALNHASLIDGARLSRARVVVVDHLDVNGVALALRERSFRRAFVVTESYFSMDADSPDLPALRQICDEYSAALIVDEAHALGVLGDGGGGLCLAQGVKADAVVGTFGKAFGAGGAFVAGCPALGSWLWNRARSFVFSTGLSPAIAAAALEGMEQATREPWRRLRVHEAANELRVGLQAMGIKPLGFGHVIPWLFGEPEDAVRAAESLCAAGIDVRAIRPPSVPEGTSRLRLTVTAAHSSDEIREALAVICRLQPKASS
ncbi:MAG: 8-amino-7-oxononanoate synthase [Myxococcota bacterium]|nr:8-amino-7-oxononanoate synthase [Myxococcota bacterium]